ncbi:MAG TPA: M23 family metallopeptidase [Firmicutes bacterium]|uniref:M23 family metallopeptidase n=1 Tax=Capillibacterium thermochitinicola TaxID=2699427 RepID=A0A8J6LIT7_9FIRM|nr:M23 family metallopeptidase [Capillibacterium thermochitinicola]MBA2133006.1 M23 family metallopeptidase [Capillibacterium thermochitinicola]HHW13021.1 M23 family metallopeptidase [Bacillota bacterium]
MSTGKQGKLDFKMGWSGRLARGWARLKQILAQTFRLSRRGWTRLVVRERFLVGALSFLALTTVGWGIGRRLSPSAAPMPLVIEEKPAVSAETGAGDYETLLRELQAELAALQAQMKTADPAQTASEAEAGPVFNPLKLTPPVAGKVTKRSGWEKKAGEWRYHSGVDLAVPPGTPVVAAAAGTVGAIKTDPALGTVVVLDHGQGWQSLYGQLTGIQVVTGQQVGQGALLGYSARTSCGPAPGIHFNLYHQENPVDPLTVLNLTQQ